MPQSAICEKVLSVPSPRSGAPVKSLVFLLLSLSAAAYSQNDVTCESHREEEATIATCTSANHESVMRCDRDGCKSHSGPREFPPIGRPMLRKMCDEGFAQDRFCTDLANELKRAETRRENGCDPSAFMYKKSDPNCSDEEAEEEKLDNIVLGRARLRIEAKKNEARLNLCAKGLFDKEYCDGIRKQMAQADRK